MKALILAAGFGTRLLPYTDTTPKCLFPVGRRPILDIIIHGLQSAGCRELIINTHHLSQKIETFLTGQKYEIPVLTRYEPEILGTGGAIKNVADFWDDAPFMVINSDIVTNISFKAAYDFHLRHPYPATVVLYDDVEFNTVAVSQDGFVIAFNSDDRALPSENKRLTFTGIQVLDPEVLPLIPGNCSSSSIDMYLKLLSAGKKLNAFIATERIWKDIGTPNRYRQTVMGRMAPEAFRLASAAYTDQVIHHTPLSGDGSDRKWYRLTAGADALILADHGLRRQDAVSEVDSFVAIGRHLFTAKIPVPQIFHYDTFSGLVFLEDLGDDSLQSVIRSVQDRNAVLSVYRSIIDILVNMSVRGAVGFDRSWTYQTQEYSRALILEKECLYFVDAFLHAYCHRSIKFKELADDFSELADKALKYATDGFMHRDLQSRNIMVKGGRHYIIDFQGGRIGPIQYDLASLMIDPYVELPYSVHHHLVDYCIERLSSHRHIDKVSFYKGYRYCCLTRNLQILGAFGYLSRQKGKTFFEKFIPIAVKSLKYNLSLVDKEEFRHLVKITDTL